MQPIKSITFFVLLTLPFFGGCKSSTEKLADAASRGDGIYKQYKSADYPTAKAALLDYIGFLDRLADSDSALKNTCKADAMVAYLRLAKLEQKNHGSDEARYMAEAVSRCAKLEVKGFNCSPDALRAAVDKMDTIPPK